MVVSVVIGRRATPKISCCCTKAKVTRAKEKESSLIRFQCEAKVSFFNITKPCKAAALLRIKGKQSGERSREANVTLCRLHLHTYKAHNMCLLCRRMVHKSEIVKSSICLSNANHLTHWRCAREEWLLNHNLKCPHCLGEISNCVKIVPGFVPNDSLTLMFRKTLLTKLDILKYYRLILTKDRCTSAKCSVPFINTPDICVYISKISFSCIDYQPEVIQEFCAWIELSIKFGLYEIVYVLRTQGSPLFSKHIAMISPEMLDFKDFTCLCITPQSFEMYSQAFSRVFAIALSSGNFSFCEEFLNFFNKVDGDMRSNPGNYTISEIEKYEKERAVYLSEEKRALMQRLGSAIRNYKFSAAYEEEQFSLKVVVRDLSNGTERFPVRVVGGSEVSEPNKFQYTTRVVDIMGILSGRKVNEDSILCQCGDDCSFDCNCNYGVYTEDGRLRFDNMNSAYLECSSDCSCSMRCGNRVAQKGATFPVEVFHSSYGAGWAVRARTRIPKGHFIGEYTGELLTEEEANKRCDVYLFSTNVGDGLFTVDARFYGNFTRFINHSCEPNAKAQLVVWEWQTEPLNHICIFATKNIAENEEITISYGEDWWKSKFMAGMTCRCGTNSCQYRNPSSTKNNLHNT